MNSAHRGSKVVRLAALGMLAVCGLLAPNCLAGDVLEQVPSDAIVVVKINHLQDTSTKLAALMQALGVTDFAPAMADPLGALENQGGMVNGIDKTGDAAIVVTRQAWAGMKTPGAEAPGLFLIPVTDYKAFLANTTVVSTDGDMSTVHFKDQSVSTEPKCVCRKLGHLRSSLLEQRCRLQKSPTA